MTVQSSGRRSSTTSTYAFSDRSLVTAEKADGDILLQAAESDLLSADNLVLDHGEEDTDEPDMVPLPKMQPQRSLRVHSPPPSVCPRLQNEERSIISQPALDPSEFMRLIDLSLRHTIGGMIPPSRNLRRPSDDTLDIQLVQAVSDNSLADISPALFRPGYMKVNLSTLSQVARH